MVFRGAIVSHLVDSQCPEIHYSLLAAMSLFKYSILDTKLQECTLPISKVSAGMITLIADIRYVAIRDFCVVHGFCVG